jgi:D-glycero-D-manno-heptose 1,7-bisphosphate phosphatase
MQYAVFFDRDGVINRLVYNPQTKEYESPHFVKDYILFPDAIQCLKHIREAGFYLFLISNQPSFAKGKTTIEEIEGIHNKMVGLLAGSDIKFDECFYCYHHPEGVVDGFNIKCQCRKPEPYFIFKARDKFDFHLNGSWLIGDQDTDIFCGQKAGIKTILIEDKFSEKKRGSSTPDFKVRSLKEAVNIIIKGNL